MLKRCESSSDKAVVSKSDFSPETSAPAIAAGLPGTCTDLEKKQKLRQVGHSALGESRKQMVQRLLFPAGDISTLLPADLWLEGLLTPSLTWNREGNSSNLQEQTHVIITKTQSQERKKCLQ